MNKISFCLVLSIPFFFARAEQEKKPLEIVSKSVATTFCCVGATIVPFLVAHKQRIAQRCSLSYSMLPLLYTAAKMNGLDHYFLIPTKSTKRNLPLALGKLGLSCLHACLGIGHLICSRHHVGLINQKIECSYNSYALAHHLISAPVFFSTAYELFRSGMSSLRQEKA